jgi:hypothetical protein
VNTNVSALWVASTQTPASDDVSTGALLQAVDMINTNTINNSFFIFSRFNVFLILRSQSVKGT